MYVEHYFTLAIFEKRQRHVIDTRKLRQNKLKCRFDTYIVRTIALSFGDIVYLYASRDGSMLAEEKIVPDITKPRLPFCVSDRADSSTPRRFRQDLALYNAN